MENMDLLGRKEGRSDYEQIELQSFVLYHVSVDYYQLFHYCW